ncbi:MAG: Dihydropteroate synthase [Bacteroidetes bacterium ADurb.Bin234]|jgi:dihydropteroate synthase|nr:MAG: Dihydropteroate synthase [Bacteroidetes bacterium ADurb.Bin234]
MNHTLNCKGYLISLEHPLVMGILNITEDSFYDGGRYFGDEKKYLSRVEQLLNEGADIIDIGVMSTRPNAIELPEEEELKRVKEVISSVVKHFPKTILSVDTWRANVARLAVDMGASIINDISGGEFDPQMFPTVANLKVPYILMHTSGKPEVMQQKTVYDNVVNDVFYYLSQRLQALNALNVSDVLIDVGFGFGKTIDQNYDLLRNLQTFKLLDCPLVLALSRKTMFWKLLNTTPEEALYATLAAESYALLQGVNILRVHDVKATKDIIKIIEKIKEN